MAEAVDSQTMIDAARTKSNIQNEHKALASKLADQNNQKGKEETLFSLIEEQTSRDVEDMVASYEAITSQHGLTLSDTETHNVKVSSTKASANYARRIAHHVASGYAVSTTNSLDRSMALAMDRKYSIGSGWEWSDPGDKVTAELIGRNFAGIESALATFEYASTLNGYTSYEQLSEWIQGLSLDDIVSLLSDTSDFTDFEKKVLWFGLLEAHKNWKLANTQRAAYESQTKPDAIETRVGRFGVASYEEMMDGALVAEQEKPGAPTDPNELKRNMYREAAKDLWQIQEGMKQLLENELLKEKASEQLGSPRS